MYRTGMGYDIHRFETGRRLVLGGVDVPHAQGLAGHSDADVVCHALMDALLGAAALGDIGMHFPDTDARWRGADSLQLLAMVAGFVREKGYVLGNVDATILAEAPRLAPHIPLMRDRLAASLGVDRDRVSVKAGTNEGLGAIGRREGIAVMAVALLDSGKTA